MLAVQVLAAHSGLPAVAGDPAQTLGLTVRKNNHIDECVEDAVESRLLLRQVQVVAVVAIAIPGIGWGLPLLVPIPQETPSPWGPLTMPQVMFPLGVSKFAYRYSSEVGDADADPTGSADDAEAEGVVVLEAEGDAVCSAASRTVSGASLQPVSSRTTARTTTARQYLSARARSCPNARACGTTDSLPPDEGRPAA